MDSRSSSISVEGKSSSAWIVGARPSGLRAELVNVDSRGSSF